MNRILTTLAASAFAAASLFAQDDRDRNTPVSAIWNTDQTPAQIGQLANGGWRVTDLEIESTAPWNFTVTAVQNSGSYQKSWWWAYDVTPAQLNAALTQYNARIVDLEPFDSNGSTRFAAVMVSNTGAEQKTWQWGYDLTSAQVDAAVQQNNGRLVNFKRYTVGGQTRYAISFITNTGSDQRTWGYLYGASLATIQANMAANNNRIYNIERIGTDSYDVVLIRNNGIAHWYYVDQSASAVTELLQQNIGRLIDIERRTTLLGTRYDLVMLDNANALERTARAKFLEAPAASLGDYGFFLKEVNGPTLAQMRPDTQFEPASTMKTVYHAHAMKAVANGTASLSQSINKPVSCGVPGNNYSLQTLLSQMMENSDNEATLAISNHFGIPAIQATANALGMGNTSINFTIGCSGPSPESQLTLRDLSQLHEQIANGYLGAQRDTFYSLMVNGLQFPTWGTDSLDTRINAEATLLGIPIAARNAFKSEIRIAYKPGGIGWTTPGPWTFYFAEGGWISVPFRSATGVDLTKEYTFGVFNNRFTGAENEIAGRDAMSDAELELVWDRVKSALATWVHYTPGTLSYFGTAGCTGSNGTPFHNTTGTGEIGDAMNFTVNSIPSPTLAVLLLGFQTVSYNGVPLPLDLAIVGAPGCVLRHDAAITEAIFASGSAQRVITLPNDPGMIGADVYSQFLIADAPANTFGWTISNTRKLTIGGWR
ncbi:MAG: hypothetical protein RLZZ562_646 [Planctomycetota bacterium]|jgi:hypothetical protein